MAVPHRAERIVGVFILLPIVALAAFVVNAGNRKGWFEKKLKLEATFDEGMALRTGASVVMEGVAIGWVDSMEFDLQDKVQVAMTIRKRFARQVRTDSVATITKLNILGDPVVVIFRGSADKPPVHSGVKIQTRATREVQPDELRQLFLDTIDLVSHLNSERSTVGKISRDEGQLYEQMNKLLASTNRLLQNAPPVPIVLTPESSLVLHLNEKLQTQVDSLFVMANRLDKLLSDVAAGRGSLGKLVTDPAMYEEIIGMIKETKELVGELRVTAGYLKQAAPGIPGLVESGSTLIKRADSTLQGIQNNPLLGGGEEKKQERPPVQIEGRFDHYRPEKPKREDGTTK